MKKHWPVLAFVCLLLAGCAAQEQQSPQEAGIADVYFLGPAEPGRTSGPLVTERRWLGEEEGAAALETLIDSMYTPNDVGNRSLIPPQVRLQSIALSGTIAIVDFSAEYQSLSALEQSLLAGGVAMTVLGQEGIEYVRITAGGVFQPPMGERYYSLDRIMLDSGAIALNAFDVTLYFISEDGEGLSAVQRTVKTAEEYPTPQALLAELSIPPEEGGLLAPLGKDETVNFCQLEGGVCRIDLSAVRRGSAGRLQIYAIVNTVTSDSGVQAAVVTVGGLPPSSAGVEGCDGELSFSQAYGR